MKKVHIIKTLIEGFGAIQDELEFNFVRPGINVMNGLNGAAKTTIFNAPVWALYGINLKGVTKDRVATWPHVRTENYRGTRVMVWLETDGYTYIVARHMDYTGLTDGKKGGNSLMVFQDGVLISTGVTDSNKLIEDIMGINSKVFLNSVLFGQRMKKLIEADDAEKRKVFDEIFNSDWVNPLKDKAKVHRDKLENEYEELSSRINNATIELKAVEEMLENYVEQQNTFTTTRKDTIDNLLRELERLEGILEGTPDNMEQLLADETEKEEQIKTLIQEKNSQYAREATALAETSGRIDTLTENLQLMEGSNVGYTTKFNSDREKLMTSIKTYIQKVQDGEFIVEETTRRIEEITTRIKELEGLGILSKKDKEAILLEHTSAKRKVQQLMEALPKLEEEFTFSSDRYTHANRQTTTEICPTCGQPITGDALIKVVKEVHTLKCQLDESELRLLSTRNDLANAEDLLNGIVNRMAAMQDSLDRGDEHEGLTKKKSLLSMELSGHKSTLSSNTQYLEETKKSLEDLVYTPPCSDELIRNTASKLDDLTPVKKSITDRFEGIKGQLNSMATEHEKIAKNRALFQRQLDESREAQISFRQTQKLLEGWEKATFAYLDKIDELITRKKSLAEDMESWTERSAQLRNQIDIYLFWEKAFGNNGLKSYIFEVMLSMLNTAMEKYASQMGVRVKFSIDLDSTRKGVITQCFKEGGVVLYDDLSGGERQRVDIVQVFGMHDIISGNVLFNILLMDEIFENLDSEGIEEVFRLLRSKIGEDMSIYVITHLNELNTMFSRTLNVIRAGGKVTVDDHGN